MLKMKDDVDEALPTKEMFGQKMYDSEPANRDLSYSIQNFRTNAKRGLQRFMSGDLVGAMEDLDAAATSNSTQPLQQRGIILYCVGEYEKAAAQLKDDIFKLEKMKFDKATELRIWHYASLNKLNRTAEAIEALDPENMVPITVEGRSRLLNETIALYSGKKEVDTLLSMVGETDREKDPSGLFFFGNLYLGLYFDSRHEPDMAQVFLSHVRSSSIKKSARDMWHHLPKVLYDQRFEQ